MSRVDLQDVDCVEAQLVKNEASKGSGKLNLPRLNLIAISQRLAVLNRKSLSDSSSDLALELRRGLSSMNHRKVWVSRE